MCDLRLCSCQGTTVCQLCQLLLSCAVCSCPLQLLLTLGTGVQEMFKRVSEQFTAMFRRSALK